MVIPWLPPTAPSRNTALASSGSSPSVVLLHAHLELSLQVLAVLQDVLAGSKGMWAAAELQQCLLGSRPCRRVLRQRAVAAARQGGWQGVCDCEDTLPSNKRNKAMLSASGTPYTSDPVCWKASIMHGARE